MEKRHTEIPKHPEKHVSVCRKDQMIQLECNHGNFTPHIIRHEWHGTQTSQSHIHAGWSWLEYAIYRVLSPGQHCRWGWR